MPNGLPEIDRKKIISTEPKGIKFIRDWYASFGGRGIFGGVGAEKPTAKPMPTPISETTTPPVPETTIPTGEEKVVSPVPETTIPTGEEKVAPKTEEARGLPAPLTTEERIAEVQRLEATGKEGAPYIWTNKELERLYGKGLPEKPKTTEDYYKETIGKMQDRASKLALDIESGFATGKRLTAAAEELKDIHATIPLLTRGLMEAGYEPAAKEAEIGKTKAERAKIEKEIAAAPGTYAETKGLIEARGVAEETAKIGLVKQYQAALTKIQGDIMLDEAEKERQILALKKQYNTIIPEYIKDEGDYIGTVGGKKYYKSKTGKILVEE